MFSGSKLGIGQSANDNIAIVFFHQNESKDVENCRFNLFTLSLNHGEGTSKHFHIDSRDAHSIIDHAPSTNTNPIGSKSTEQKNQSSKTEAVDDYMSMDYILNAQSFDKSNVVKRRSTGHQPRVVRSKSKKRKLPSKDRVAPRPKKAKVRMEERRNEGMATPIPEHNIGFKLLSKMGFEKGMTIGKQRSDEIALREPIGITIRDNKSGLGIHERKEERTKILSKYRRAQKRQKANVGQTFKQSVRERTRRVQCIRDIKQSRIICHNLDVKVDAESKNPLWSNPIEAEQKWNALEPEIKYDEFSSVSLAECEPILSELIGYLRSEHRYCYWCGILYKSESEMDASCPGLEKSQHDSLTDF